MDPFVISRASVLTVAFMKEADFPSFIQFGDLKVVQLSIAALGFGWGCLRLPFPPPAYCPVVGVLSNRWTSGVPFFSDGRYFFSHHPGIFPHFVPGFAVTLFSLRSLFS